MKLVPYLLLLAFPLMELGLLIKVGQVIGFWSTCGIVFGTAVVGAAIISHQGFSAPFKAQEALARGEPPAARMFDSALAVVGGVLLLTPGLIADATGLCLQIPIVRRLVGRWLIGRFFSIEDVVRERRTNPAGGAEDPTSQPRGTHRNPADGRPPRSERPKSGPVIEGEFERLGERTLDPDRRKDEDADRR